MTDVQRENLGPAERIISNLLTYTDHLVHNRPGIIVPVPSLEVGVRWEPAALRDTGDQKSVFKLIKRGKATKQEFVGNLDSNNLIQGRNLSTVGEYRPAGIFPEVAAWWYRQIAEVWKLDNEFAARWASHAFFQEHRDLKTILAAFMLVQSRKGDPVIENGKKLFNDDDFRDVGEAMFLTYGKGNASMNPKLLLRVRYLLALPQIAEINRELGFGVSARKAFLGRWDKAVHKWLSYREDNPKLLEGLVKAGFRKTVMQLARLSGYKPQTSKFFQTLRWKQVQAEDGRRILGIGEAVTVAEAWDNLTEAQICSRIIEEKPSWKVIIGRVPVSIGITRAIVAASIEAGALSNKDLIQATPTLEDLGLLQVQTIREKWEAALKKAEDQRAANIAERVKSKEVQEKLQEASDTATKKVVEKAMANLRIYFMVDISASMNNALVVAKKYLEKILPGFPLDSIHISVFNTRGREIFLKHSSAAGVEQAFRGIQAGGGTRYEAGFEFYNHPRNPNEDVLFFYVGDEAAPSFANAVRSSGLNPSAMAFAYVPGGMVRESAVRRTASDLGIPYIEVDEAIFSDVYATPRILSNLIASTPITQYAERVSVRKTLVDTILETPLLTKPVWAAV